MSIRYKLFLLLEDVLFSLYSQIFYSIVLAELWPVLERCTVIAKKDVMYFGTFGLATWLWGTIFIDRSKAKEAQESINSTSKIVKERKARLLMFPEGKRYNGSELMPFKKGGFHVAITSQLPIQPIVISRYYFLNSKLKRFNSGNQSFFKDNFFIR